MDLAPTRIGLDMGGSGARAASIDLEEDGWFSCGELREISWDDDFRPVPFHEQLSSPGETTTEEEACARRRVGRLAELIVACAEGWPFSLNVAAPGLPTQDRAGILAWRNGPRCPTLLVELRREFDAKDVTLLGGATRLRSDAVACALGERRARAGALRGISSGLCISGGSGVGEAVVIGGLCFGLDDLDPPIPRAWELSGGGGCSLEDRVAPGRVLEQWREAGGEGTPEESELAEAAVILDARDEGIVALIERSRDWFEGRGLTLERVALCQRLGALLARAPERVSAMEERLGEVELVVSELRAAPVIGATVLIEEPER